MEEQQAQSDQPSQQKKAKAPKPPVICSSCGKEGTRNICSGCRSVYYCDEQCQKAGWRDGHKTECATRKNDKLKHEKKGETTAQGQGKEGEAARTTTTQTEPVRPPATTDSGDASNPPPCSFVPEYVRRSAQLSPSSARSAAEALLRRACLGHKKISASALNETLEMHANLFVDVSDYLGATLLHWAAYHDDVTLAEALLAKGADPNANSLDTPPPLFIAALCGSQKVLDLLLNKGANVSARWWYVNQDQIVEIVTASIPTPSPDLCRLPTPSNLASAPGQRENYKKGRAGVPAFWTVLHFAALAPSSVGSIRSLLAAGAPLDVKAGKDYENYKSDWRPIHMAGLTGRAENFVALLEAGADPREPSGGYSISPMCSPVTFTFDLGPPSSGPQDALKAMIIAINFYNVGAGFERFMPEIRQPSKQETKKMCEKLVDLGVDPSERVKIVTGDGEMKKSAVQLIRAKGWNDLANSLEARWRARRT